MAVKYDIRTIVLMVITLVLITMMVTSYIALYANDLCNKFEKNSLGINSVDIFNDNDENEPLKSKPDTESDLTDDNEKSKNWNRNNKSCVCKGVPWNYNWDLKSSLPTKLKQERNIILVRHGQYDFVSGKLTERGMRQAKRTGFRLAQMNLTLVSIHHSTLTRAIETATIIHDCLNRNVPLTDDPMLVEGGPVPPNPTISYWSLPERDYHIDGPRFESAFRKYFYRLDDDISRKFKSSHEIIVAHGNIIRFFVLRSLQLPIDSWMRMFIPHASITRLNIRHDGVVSMSLFGDSGHLDYSDVTY